jgi:hypothetical protein
MNRKLILGSLLAIGVAFCIGFWLRPARNTAQPQPEAIPSGPTAPSPVVTEDQGIVEAMPTNAPTLSSPELRALVDAGVDYRLRLAGVKAVTTNLSRSDLQGLYSFLLAKDPSDADQLGQVLKNRLMDALCLLEPPPAGLGDTLTALYRDASQNTVLRDYAVQHLAAYYEQLGSSTGMDPQQMQQEQAKTQAVLWEALKETDSSIAGTSLLALTRLSSGRAEFDQAQIGAAALRLAAPGAAGELTQISALEVSAQLGVKDAVPILSQVAETGDSIPLRIAAVAGLGELRATDAEPMLEEMINGPEERLRLPARVALARISKQH